MTSAGIKGPISKSVLGAKQYNKIYLIFVEIPSGKKTTQKKADVIST